MKPITVLKHEFDESLVNLVNRCGLPACVIRPSIANLLTAIDKLEEEQYRRDLQAIEGEANEEAQEAEEVPEAEPNDEGENDE